MTVISVDLRRRTAAGVDAPIAAAASMQWTPLARRVEPDFLVLAAGFDLALIDGVGTCDLPAMTAWQVREFTPSGVTLYVVIPQVAAVDYEDLVSVDPATLQPSQVPEAAWWAALTETVLTGSPGPQGEVGPQGGIGAQGVPGLQGGVGPQGTIGATGSTGSQGVQGVQGVQGDIGVTGPAGGPAPITSSPEIAHTVAATLTSADLGRSHYCHLAAAAYTLTLPTPVGRAGQQIAVRVTRTSITTLTLWASAGTIDGVTYRIMCAEEAATLMSDGADWVKIAGRIIPMRAGLYVADAAPTLLNATMLQVPLTGVRYDNTGLMTLTTSVVTIKRQGVYLVASRVALSQPATTLVRFINVVRKNNVSVIQQEQSGCMAGGFPVFLAQDDIDCAAGDTLTQHTYQTCTGPATMTIFNGTPPDRTGLAVREIPSW